MRREIHLAWLALVLGLGAAVLAAPTIVTADTFTVSVLTDSPHDPMLNGTCTSQLMGGACTLRAAVQAANYLAANAQPGPHTINLAAQGIYKLTVHGNNENSAATGDLDVNGANVSIANTSGGAVAVDGDWVDRVFDVGPASAAQLSIDGITIQNGYAIATLGGGVLVNTNSTLTLTNATVDVAASPVTAVSTAPTTVALPSHPASIQLTVHRVTAGQAATAELTVTDGCGAWPTFFGGGPGAF